MTYIEITVTKSILESSNQVFIKLFQDFLRKLATLPKNKNIKPKANLDQMVLEEIFDTTPGLSDIDDYFFLKINVKNMFDFYNRQFGETILTNSYTNESIPLVLKSIDIALQYFLGLNRKDYLVRSIGLNLVFLGSGENGFYSNGFLWLSYFMVIENRMKTESDSIVTDNFFAIRNDDSSLLISSYDFDNPYPDDTFLDGTSIYFSIDNIQNELSFDLLKYPRNLFYSYLQPIEKEREKISYLYNEEMSEFLNDFIYMYIIHIFNPTY